MISVRPSRCTVKLIEVGETLRPAAAVGVIVTLSVDTVSKTTEYVAVPPSVIETAVVCAPFVVGSVSTVTPGYAVTPGSSGVGGFELHLESMKLNLLPTGTGLSQFAVFAFQIASVGD